MTSILKNIRDLKNAFTEENVSKCLTQMLFVVLFWSTVWGVKGRDAEPPNGYIFNIFIITISAYLCGKLVKLAYCPKLFGMLVIGFLLGNRKMFGATEMDLQPQHTSLLRRLANIIVLLRAGLELHPDIISKLSWICVRLAIVPCVCETLAITATAQLLLDYPLEWGLMLGFLLAPISPAVLFPPILNLQEQGYGCDKDIPSILLLSASIDDIIAITAFGFCQKFIFEDNFDLLWIMIKIPSEPLIGVMSGILLGLILWYIPAPKSPELIKFLILFLSGTSTYFVFRAFDMMAAGPEACFVTAFCANIQWRSDQIHDQIQYHLKQFWSVFQPMLFGLTGAEVKLEFINVKDWKLYYMLAVIMCGLIARFLAVVLVTFGHELTLKERLFMAYAWLPKATFQVAVAPIILERSLGSDNQTMAESVVTMAFLSVLITVPLGALAINILGPKVLKKTTINGTVI